MISPIKPMGIWGVTIGIRAGRSNPAVWVMCQSENVCPVRPNGRSVSRVYLVFSFLVTLAP